MNSTHLSVRLATVGKYVKPNSRLADIGSDHAYLPINLALNGIIKYGVVGEVREGPLDNAKHEIAKAGLNEMLQPRLADGLAAIEPGDNVDHITIAGMGGALITHILESDKERLTGEETLILQPNVGEENVRRWLMDNGYTITAEDILEEDGHIYEIIVGQQIGQVPQYAAEDLFFGPKLRIEQNQTFIKKWQRELTQKQGILDNIVQSHHADQTKVSQFTNEIEMIKEILNSES
ncbi:tRNA (adenine(22)-N(1))-methyltransferase [Lentilactobacillus sp. SPB1-3]|uniref:tRNA (Adenine(22)-N(1))-methyltransferase TrmK n=1 Tax=Lentilactobacillus terminaliae TaxID=3003483 RepID=A0ACD5DCY7_9LACO|nr:class I SAM-dependent methyltransferase [Lentilactobacillus sp. SPB1-3]MCZ0977269.1 class I SAM-dependent methyltransferase [Lentilactobacillus sp. SPB1-3]